MYFLCMWQQSASYLNQCWVQVDVVGHDDSADYSHRLFQLHRPTACTVRNKHPLQQLPLVWLHKDILDKQQGKNMSTFEDEKKYFIYITNTMEPHLITKAKRHYSNEETKEGFQFPQACGNIQSLSTLSSTT